MFQKFFQDYILYHGVTILVIAVIIILLIVHHKGSQKNMSLAQQYRTQLEPQLKKNFNDYDGDLVIEAPNIIKMYASGRESCLFMILAFGLVPRQQIVSFLFNAFFIKLNDQLVVEVPILNQFPISLTMAIIVKKEIKKLTKKKYPDIKQLCKQYKPALNSAQNVPDTHSMLLQKVQHFKYFLHNEQDIQLWKEHGKSVKMVYMSDVNRFSRYPMAVRLAMNLGPQVAPIMEWLMRYVDRMSKARMSSGERREARKRREGLQFEFQI